MLQPQLRQLVFTHKFSKNNWSLCGQKSGPNLVRVKQIVYQKVPTNVPRNAADFAASLIARKDVCILRPFRSRTRKFNPKYMVNAALHAFQNLQHAWSSQLFEKPWWTTYRLTRNSLKKQKQLRIWNLGFMHGEEKGIAVSKCIHTSQGIRFVTAGSPQTLGRPRSSHKDCNKGACPVSFPYTNSPDLIRLSVVIRRVSASATPVIHLL